MIMSNIKRQIGMVYLKDEVSKSWIANLHAVAYHVEDVMDKYSYHVLQVQEEGFLKKLFIKGTNYVKVFSEIADEVVAVEKEILQITEMKGQFTKLVPNQFTKLERQNDQSSFLELLKDQDLVGMEDNRKLLTGWLYSKEPKTTVIAVSGMGGLGKTALVTNVYRRENINFQAHAWIVVSQIYTIDDLLMKLLRKIGYIKQFDKMDTHDLKKEIHKKLENRKCLIVLDDVWEQEVYFQIHDALQDLQGSRILITTRTEHVTAISSPTRRLELQPLSMNDAFYLFCRRAFCDRKGHMCPNELEMIAADIVGKCHGLPQAIVRIGCKLSGQPLNIWKKTYYQLHRGLSNNDHVGSVLNLSYHDLPAELQICILYCTLFPEDNPMSRDNLVRLWVAEGFVLSNENNTAEVVAERYIMELIYRNMLEVVENDEFGRVKICKMHAIVRKQAISIARGERLIFVSVVDSDTTLHMVDKDIRCLSLCGWRANVAQKFQFPLLRTLVAVGVISYSPGMLSSVLSKSKYLTVLELQDSEVTEVPASIGSLFNLCYIGLRRTKVKSLPDCIENLSNLQTLDVKQTKIQKLPRGIVKMKKLRHLLADRYDDDKQTEFPAFIGVKPLEMLSNMEELQTLETVKLSNGLAEQLKKLMQLRSVSIENIGAADCENLFATLSDIPLLSSLLLSARDEKELLCFKALKPKSADLQRLIIRGQLKQVTLNCPIFLHHGPHLRYLALSWCGLGADRLEMLATHLPNLTYLRLANVHSAPTLVISGDYFPNVKTLVLKHMPDVWAVNIIDGALPCIEGLYIMSLSNMENVPRGIESLRSLKKLWLLDLHRNFISKWVNNKMPHKMLHVPEVRI